VKTDNQKWKEKYKEQVMNSFVRIRELLQCNWNSSSSSYDIL